MTEAKPKRKLTEKQLAALAAGRAKRAENIKNGIKTERKKKINTKSDDYLAGVIRGIEMDRRIAGLEDKQYKRTLDELDQRGYEVNKLPYIKKNVKQYQKKELSQKQLDALAAGRKRGRPRKNATPGEELFND